MVLMMFFTYILYGIGQRKQFNNLYDVFEYYCGKYIGKVYTWYSVILLYGIYIVMLAGATIHQYYGTSIYIGTYGVAFFVINGQSAKSVKEARISGMIGTGVYTLAIILLIITETVYLDIIKG